MSNWILYIRNTHQIFWTNGIKLLMKFPLYVSMSFVMV